MTGISSAYGCSVLSVHDSRALFTSWTLGWVALELCTAQPVQLNMASLINYVLETVANDY